MATEQLQIRVLLFSVLRDRVGERELAATLAAPANGRDLLDHLAGRHPTLAAYRPVIRLAVNQTFAPDDAPLADGDEVALITPVSGG